MHIANRLLLAIMASTSLLCASCEKKPAKKDIIVPPPVEKKAETGPQRMSDTKQTTEVQWLGNTYKISIVRKPDEQLPKVTDENGIVYFDNSITLRIARADGSYFVDKTYRKSDFSQYVSSTGFDKPAVLLGVVFDQLKDNKLTFAVSVGSPDRQSDEFVPMIMTINNMGDTSVTLDTQMDTGTDAPASSNGVTGDEEA